MRNIRFILLFVIGIVLIQNNLTAQKVNVTKEQVMAELDKRGLTEEEVRNALLDNDIDPDNLEDASPEEILKIKKIIEDLEKIKNENEFKTPSQQDTLKPIETTGEPVPVDSMDQIEKVDKLKSDSIMTIYGHDVLSIPVKKKNKDVKVNEYYILGPGDKISISIWSDNSHFDNNFVIDNDGYIKISLRDLKKRIYVKGLPLFKARKKIRKDLSQFMIFKEGEINIDLQSSRNIDIAVYGEVVSPGSYSIDATNTVFEGIRYALGVTDIASVRKIKLITLSGDFKIFDLYKYLLSPEYKNNFFLGNNDMIHVPVAEKLVTIKGAVKRPQIYELIDDEGISDIIKYAGGFDKNAIKENLSIERYVDNKKVILSIDYLNKDGKISDFVLKDGDIITVNSIKSEAENYYEIKGAVYNSGKFGMKDGMKISDAVSEAGLMPDARTDFAFLLRTGVDGKKRYISINLDSVLANKNDTEINFLLKNEDILRIWSLKRYTDKVFIKVSGAVRDTGKYIYGPEESIRISDAVVLAGGLARDASDIGFIHRQDPMRNFEKQYIRINISDVLKNENSQQNIQLKPFDNLEILSQNLFNEKSFVLINGAVNNPGKFQFGNNMTLKDLLILAGGFKMAASTNNIEVSRIEIKNNKPTKVIVGKMNIDKNMLFENNSDNYILQPYDNVFVRYVPEFEMQKIVTLTGEVKYPGKYTISTKNERISDLIERAGGVTEEAFLDGATLYRDMDSTGFIVMGLEDAMKHYKSKFNYLLKDGDIIEIPKQRDFVTIRGATKVYEKYNEEVAFNKYGINVPFHYGKRAMYYINKYAGGINDDASKKNILVKHPNGEIEKTVNYGVFNVYPKVRKGSIIEVGYKKKKSEDDKKKKDVDWNKIITDSVAQISTIMTLVILFKSISQ